MSYEEETREVTEFEQELMDYFYDGYQALGNVIVNDVTDEMSYEMGYLDAYADAMHELGWFLGGAPVENGDRFPLFTSELRETARGWLR